MTIHVIFHFILNCTVINCGNLENVGNGAVDTSGGTNYKCAAVYTCNIGYIIIGNIARLCQENATWSGSEPTCDGM